MSDFFPHRRPTPGELSIIPEALIRLFLARLKVSLLHPEAYLQSRSIAPSHSRTVAQSQGRPVAPSQSRLYASVINGLAMRTPWKSTCLVKALAAHKMLKRRKIAHTIHFGVKQNNSKLEAHAWLSVGGVVIIGGDNAEEYVEVGRMGKG